MGKRRGRLDRVSANITGERLDRKRQPPRSVTRFGRRNVVRDIYELKETGAHTGLGIEAGGSARIGEKLKAVRQAGGYENAPQAA
jgi:hypothetical protein